MLIPYKTAESVKIGMFPHVAESHILLEWYHIDLASVVCHCSLTLKHMLWHHSWFCEHKTAQGYHCTMTTNQIHVSFLGNTMTLCKNVNYYNRIIPFWFSAHFACFGIKSKTSSFPTLPFLLLFNSHSHSIIPQYLPFQMMSSNSSESSSHPYFFWLYQML